jgi:mannosyl-oligosaccharide glucosidase
MGLQDYRLVAHKPMQSAHQVPCAVLCCAVLMQRELVRETSEQPKLQYVPDFGYASLFPLLMQLIPADSDILGQQLQLLRQQDLLWTQHGLRSLATTSSIYNK